MRERIRVVVMHVDAMSHGLLQREEVNRLPLQDVCSGCKELVKSPTLLLVGLHDTSEHWHQLGLQAPPGKQEKKTDKYTADVAHMVLRADIL